MSKYIKKNDDQIPYDPSMLLEGEIWKPVVTDRKFDYSELYLISNKGRLRSLLSHNKPRDVLLNDNLVNGYVHNGLCVEGKSEYFYRHRLVALTFIGYPPSPEHTVNHINEIKVENNVDNLEWATPQEQQDCSNSIFVVQLDIEYNIINTFKSSHEASRVTGFNQSAICKASKGMYSKKNSHGGTHKYKNYYWCLESELDEFLEKYKKNRKIKGE